MEKKMKYSLIAIACLMAAQASFAMEDNPGGQYDDLLRNYDLNAQFYNDSTSDQSLAQSANEAQPSWIQEVLQYHTGGGQAVNNHNQDFGNEYAHENFEQLLHEGQLPDTDIAALDFIAEQEQNNNNQTWANADGGETQSMNSQNQLTAITRRPSTKKYAERSASPNGSEQGWNS
jgi:hypothetical protein